MADRKRQLAEAQGSYRLKRRSVGDARLQTWIPEHASIELKSLCAAMRKGQGEVLELAIARLSAAEQHRDDKETSS